jgi:hypothetical protein
MSACNPPIRCADGVLRSGLGQWQGYLTAVWDDPEQAAQRLTEVPDPHRPVVEAHLRSMRVIYWVQRVLLHNSLDARRSMLQQCPPDLVADVRDQVAVLFDLRRTKAPTP